MRYYADLEIIFEELECITQFPFQITIWLKFKALLEDLPKQMTSKSGRYFVQSSGVQFIWPH